MFPHPIIVDVYNCVLKGIRYFCKKTAKVNGKYLPVIFIYYNDARINVYACVRTYDFNSAQRWIRRRFVSFGKGRGPGPSAHDHRTTSGG